MRLAHKDHKEIKMSSYCISLGEAASNICNRITKAVLVLFAMVLFHPIPGWTDTTTLTPIKDTYVDQITPTSQYGNSTLINTKYAPSRKSSIRETLLQFDLSRV